MDSEISELLLKVSSGDEAALAELTPLVYGELRRIARSQMRRHRFNHSSEPSSLVHEAYLRLLHGQPVALRSRFQLLGIAAHLMREVLVDQARAKKAQKRSWGIQVDIDGAGAASREYNVDVLALSEALDVLARRDKNLVDIIELHFFGGLTAEEAANVTGQSVHAVRHRLRYAKAWLRQHLKLS